MTKQLVIEFYENRLKKIFSIIEKLHEIQNTNLASSFIGSELDIQRGEADIIVDTLRFLKES
jgi:hypothetical protein